MFQICLCFEESGQKINVINNERQNQFQTQLYSQQINKQNQIKGMSLQDFTLLNVIGKGSFSKVVLVRKKDDKKLYALKILKKKLIHEKNQYRNLITERNILINTNHPFIIKHYSAFQNNKKLFFLLEYCPGGELFNLLWRKKTFNESQTLFYVAQIVLGLEYLHDLNIIYRDLKPENVLIDIDGYIKLADFGLSKMQQNNQNMKSVCGTKQYYAPEIFTGKGYGREIDYWTLGCLCFELISGKPPFQNEYEILNTDINQICSSLNCSIEFKDFIINLLQRNPQKRMNLQQCKQHKALHVINWDQIREKKVSPAFTIVKQFETDISHIDYQFVNDNPISQSSSYYNTYFDKKFQGNVLQKLIIYQLFYFQLGFSYNNY
ncbi:protein kinase domain protein [Ichthyophthirius multifiliis]|uniref:non-specific serine/threonine protein kinase n=1 Tax=Ichthyophthirius multifiliis TaxID=5932 RepID=G0QZV1_ICHMU|nr:protein kinase domain protein [Ichthyophthirius multifiliis]EGR29246.1 protein kinase domain protein [Ichthyophthirius multifiliis]|eukprot:XP_004030482.1 protein kinase domain protein [Ichthyophthirius multifiliis]